MTFPHSPSRRDVLLSSGTLFAWAYLPKAAQAEGRDPRFLAIVLRGALDGLATVAPVGDPYWVSLRDDEALTLGGKTAALKLDNFFALNPAMPNLHRMFLDHEAIVVHAAATPYRERSHFDGQDVLESGMTKPNASDSGWLNRALAGLAPGAPCRSERQQNFRRRTGDAVDRARRRAGVVMVAAACFAGERRYRASVVGALQAIGSKACAYA